MVHARDYVFKTVALVMVAVMMLSIPVMAEEYESEDFDIAPIAIETGQTLTFDFPKQYYPDSDDPIEMVLIQQLDTGAVNRGDYLVNLNIGGKTSTSGSIAWFQIMTEWSLVINGIEYLPRVNSVSSANFSIYLDDVSFRYISVKCKLKLYPMHISDIKTSGSYIDVVTTATISAYSLTQQTNHPKQEVVDSTGNALQEEQNKLQQEGNKLQEEANDLQKEANETSKGIFGSIKDFFAGFFSNLGNTVLGWIVPSSEELTAFLEEVNQWFSDRLGFIWYPFSLAVQIVTALAGGTADSSITVPAFSLNMMGTTYNIWEPLTIDMDAMDIFKYVRYFTTAMLVCGIAKLAYNKWDEWIGGHNA